MLVLSETGSTELGRQAEGNLRWLISWPATALRVDTSGASGRTIFSSQRAGVKWPKHESPGNRQRNTWPKAGRSARLELHVASAQLLPVRRVHSGEHDPTRSTTICGELKCNEKI